MSELPVFFATTDGQTRRIAEAFALVELNARPSMFLPVSLSICSRLPDEVDTAGRMASAFPEHLGWKAGRVVCIAGRLAYTQYGLLKRFVMRRIAMKAGGPADTSRDHEMTDWGQVRAMAAALVGIMERSTRQAAAV